METLVAPENNKLLITFTLETPLILKQMLYSFVIIQFILLIIILQVQRSEHKKREQLSRDWKKRTGDTVTQVVHDIRSPLAALKFIATNTNDSKNPKLHSYSSFKQTTSLFLS